MSGAAEVQWAKGQPMRAQDLQPCALCGKGVMHTGVPLFYRVKIQRMGVDVGEVRRTSAMESFMGPGGLAIARALYDGAIAKPLTDEQTALVCEDCSLQPHLFAMLAEKAV